MSGDIVSPDESLSHIIFNLFSTLLGPDNDAKAALVADIYTAEGEYEGVPCNAPPVLLTRR